MMTQKKVKISGDRINLIIYLSGKQFHGNVYCYEIFFFFFLLWRGREKEFNGYLLSALVT